MVMNITNSTAMCAISNNYKLDHITSAYPLINSAKDLNKESLASYFKPSFTRLSLIVPFQHTWLTLSYSSIG